MKTKKSYKYFTVADFERETAYLNHMQQAGWELQEIEITPFLMKSYRFTACEPRRDIRYALLCQSVCRKKCSFSPPDTWELVTRKGFFSYYRLPIKEAAALQSANLSALSLVCRQLLFSLIALLLISPYWLRHFPAEQVSVVGKFSFLLFLASGIFYLYVFFLFMHTCYRYITLKHTLGV